MSGSYDDHQLEAVLVNCPTCGHPTYRTQVHGLYTGPCDDCDRNGWLEWFCSRRRRDVRDVSGVMMNAD